MLNEWSRFMTGVFPRLTLSAMAMAAALLLAGCGESAGPPAQTAETESAPASSQGAAQTAEPADTTTSRLEKVLADQPEELKARYPHRHPRETLEFFGIEPGMTVVEALPGGGWYTKILLPYLGSDGRLIGVNYPNDIWAEFGTFDDEFIESMQTWTTDWPERARQWRGADGAAVDAFVFGQMPDELAGQADAVLIIRALHNLARFEESGGYLTTALQDVHRALKPGGIVGVVQHEARPDMPDEWASGANAYLKEQFVVDRMRDAGLELVASSDVNRNPNDQPTIQDSVWRLPPSYRGAGDDPEARAARDAIGESNRMTLLFRKAE